MTSSKPYHLPSAPTGTELIVRARIVEGGATELKKVDADAEGSYSPFAPISFFSAFSAEGEHLGTWSPGYTDLGWTQFSVGFAPGTATGELFRLLDVSAQDLLDGRGPARDAIRDARDIWARVLVGKTAISTWTVRS